MSNDDDTGSELSDVEQQQSVDPAPSGEDRIPEGLPPELEEFLRTFPEGRRSAVLSVIEHQMTAFRGPVPPPEILSGYDKVQPGFADRLLREAEAEGAARRKAQEATVIKDIVALSLGTVVQLGFFVLAGIALWLEQPWAAVPLGLGGVIGVLARRFFPFARDESDRDSS